MYEVTIYIESTWRGPSRRDGVAMWLVETMVNEQPVTRKGFVHVENGTEAQGTLMALVNAFFILKKRCSVRVFTPCEHVLYTVQNHWHIRWQDEGWKNARGKPVKNGKLWKMLIEKMEEHVYSFDSYRHAYTNVMQMELNQEYERWKEDRERG